MSSPRKSLGRSSLSRQFDLIAEQSTKKFERRGGRAETRVIKPKIAHEEFVYEEVVKRSKNTKRRKSLSKK